MPCATLQLPVSWVLHLSSESQRPPPTASQCWEEFKDRINQCVTDFSTTPEARAQCLQGARATLRDCLADVPTPNPPPTRDTCWDQYITDLKNCNSTFPPNPDNPNSLVNEKNKACTQGATDKLNDCLRRTPRPTTSVAVGASSATISGVSSSYELRFTVGEAAPSEVEFFFLADDAEAPNGHRRIGLLIVSNLLPKSETKVQCDLSVGALSGLSSVVLVAKSLDENGELLGADALQVLVTWDYRDVTRDGEITYDDLQLALVMLANGEVSVSLIADITAYLSAQ